MIINPCAGKDSKRIGAIDIMSKLASADFDFEVRATRCQGDATTIVKEIGENFDMIICCGGDGTLNETINGLLKIDKKIPIGYVPSGSTNDLATTLGIPTNVGPATDLIMSGKLNTYDVGSFNGRYFNYVASFGVGVDLSYSTPQWMKNMLGYSAYIINGFVIRIIPMLLNFRATHMKIEYDDGVIEDDFFFGALSNSTSVAGIFNYKDMDIKLNDGYFELMLVRGLKNNMQAFSILDKVLHKDYNNEHMMLVKTKKVKITCEKEIPWTLDGEFGGNVGNVELEVIHDAFRIYSDNDKLFLNK